MNHLPACVFFRRQPSTLNIHDSGSPSLMQLGDQIAKLEWSSFPFQDIFENLIDRILDQLRLKETRDIWGRRFGDENSQMFTTWNEALINGEFIVDHGLSLHLVELHWDQKFRFCQWIVTNGDKWHAMMHEHEFCGETYITCDYSPVGGPENRDHDSKS